MKFFTPDLLERFRSEDDRVSLAAHDELETRSERYAEHLKAILSKAPPRFRELQERFYLHDARVVWPALPWLHPAFQMKFLPEMVWGFPFWERSVEAAPERFPSFLMALQLDPPPKEVLVLHYRLVRIDAISRHWPLDERCPFLEWQHDEVELVSANADQPEFAHAILFTNGIELQLRFSDFDFATLKPMGLPSEPEARARSAS